jgi:hypothetical protein
MALVVKAARDRNVGKRELPLLQQHRTMLDTQLSNVFTDRPTMTASECLGEM